MKRKLSVPVASACFTIILITLLLGAPAYAQQFIMAPYLPLYPDNWWKYTTNGTDTYVEKVLPEQVVVNSVVTRVLDCSDGSKHYLTNDSSGIRLHKLDDPEGTATFMPPVVISPSISTLGQSVNSNGTARLYIPSASTFDFNYSASSSALTVETVSVPYGTFEALKIKNTLRIVGSIYGVTIDESSIGYSWYVRDIGIIKIAGQYNGKTIEDVLVLTDTNLPMKKNIVPPLLLLLLK
ncbi:MAG: hypothetical protein GQ559_05030 [Desulfobulbaceae bacterium]|nr:hypothetical protein [Desulfobulbaceae bacterium]